MARRTTLTMPQQPVAKSVPPSPPSTTDRSEAKQVRNRRSGRGGIRGMIDEAFNLFSAARTYYQAATTNRKMRIPMDIGPNSANDEIPVLRARSRYARANYGWYRQTMNQFANNVVSYGISPIIKYPDLKKLYKLWGEEADARGRFTIEAMQWHIALHVATDGEMLARFRDRLDGDMLSGVPLQIQLMPADHLPIGYTMLSPTGNWILDGVERSPIERVVNYWLLPKNPLDWRSRGAVSSTPVPVPAEDVCHIFWPETVQSERGAPWAAAVLNAMELLRDYQLNEVEKKALQSKFTVMYTKPQNADLDGKSYAGDEDDDGEPILPAIPAGAAVEVEEGYKPELVDMPQTDPNYEAFTRLTLAEVAVAVGLCVEQITLDFSKVNDRVYRAMMLEIARFIQSIQYHMMVAQFLAPMWRRFVSAAILAGKWVPPEGAKPEDYMRVEWMTPARGHIHPIQEVQAFMMAVQAGFTSRSQVAAEFGVDIEELDMENASDFQRAQTLGTAYSPYDGWVGQPLTPEMAALRKLQQQAVIDAIQKMAEENSELAA